MSDAWAAVCRGQRGAWRLRLTDACVAGERGAWRLRARGAGCSRGVRFRGAPGGSGTCTFLSAFRGPSREPARVGAVFRRGPREPEGVGGRELEDAAGAATASELGIEGWRRRRSVRGCAAGSSGDSARAADQDAVRSLFRGAPKSAVRGLFLAYPRKSVAVPSPVPAGTRPSTSLEAPAAALRLGLRSSNLGKLGGGGAGPRAAWVHLGAPADGPRAEASLASADPARADGREACFAVGPRRGWGLGLRPQRYGSQGYGRSPC